LVLNELERESEQQDSQPNQPKGEQEGAPARNMIQGQLNLGCLSAK
jgi:hypothetical protein